MSGRADVIDQAQSIPGAPYSASMPAPAAGSGLSTRRRVVYTGGSLALAAGAVLAPAWSPFASPPPTHVLSHVLAGLSFLLVGIMAWSRRPGNRTGILMTIAGLAWYVPDLRWWGWGPAWVIGNIYAYGPFVAVLTHLVVAFPGGRLRNRFERVVIVSVYAYVGIQNLILAMVWDGLGGDCSPCPANPLRIAGAENLLAKLDVANVVVLTVLVMLVATAVIRHWMASVGRARRVLFPVLAAAVPVAILVISFSVVQVTGAPGWFFLAYFLLFPLAVAAVPVGLLVGLLRSRIARWGVGDLVLELARPMKPGELRAVLARALGDPSLQVAYPHPDSGSFVTSTGAPVELPTNADRGVTILGAPDDPTAVLIHDSVLNEDPALVQAVGAAAGLSIENERLSARVRAQLEEVRASRARIVEATDAERRRVERNIHDGAQQRMVTLGLALRRAGDCLAGPNHAARTLLAQASEELDAALQDLRELARGIHPAILTDEGLSSAVDALAERSTVPVEIHDRIGSRLPPSVEAAAYFVVCEALANVAKYAGASMAEVRLTCHPGHLVIEVIDDGVGGADLAGGSGLRGLKDRLAALDGSLEVLSRPSAGGTTIRAKIPTSDD